MGIFYRLGSIILLIIFISGCRGAMKAAKRAKRVNNTYENIKRASSSSSSNSSSSNKTQISDAKLKEMAKAANKTLERYRVDCANFKRAFDTATTSDQYNKAFNGFRAIDNHFSSWYNSQKFHTYDCSSSFASKYNNWRTKFNNYYKTYRDAVLQSQEHSHKQVYKQPLSIKRTVIVRRR